MAFLTLHEMLPLAIDYAGQKQAVKAVFIGMAFMSARYCLIIFIQIYNFSPFNCFQYFLHFHVNEEFTFFFFGEFVDNIGFLTYISLVCFGNAVYIFFR